MPCDGCLGMDGCLQKGPARKAGPEKEVVGDRGLERDNTGSSVLFDHVEWCVEKLRVFPPVRLGTRH